MPIQKYICKHSSRCEEACYHKLPHETIGCEVGEGGEERGKKCIEGYIIEPCIPYTHSYQPIKEVEKVVDGKMKKEYTSVEEGVGESNVEEVEAILDRLQGKTNSKKDKEESPVPVHPISKTRVRSWKLSPIEPHPPEADIIIESKSDRGALNKSLRTLGWKLEKL